MMDRGKGFSAKDFPFSFLTSNIWTSSSRIFDGKQRLVRSHKHGSNSNLREVVNQFHDWTGNTGRENTIVVCASKSNRQILFLFVKRLIERRNSSSIEQFSRDRIRENKTTTEKGRQTVICKIEKRKFKFFTQGIPLERGLRCLDGSK